ncbi:MAG: T9SS type A sorting domain-containing protein [Ferruginibacter sp.]|nr:T9SS type A sorting domain-containing protein [Ferruginibacter sp.]
MYPNPATNYVQFDFAGKQKIILVNIFDIEDRLLQTTTIPNQTILKLPITTLPKGKYVVQLSDGEVNAMGSFIKYLFLFALDMPLHSWSGFVTKKIINIRDKK